MAKSIHKDYKDKVRMRFLEVMRRIIMSRVNGVKNVTQFAEYIGEYQQNINKMESGERYPTIDQICRLCEVFNFSPSWLLLGKGNMQETAEMNAALAILTDRVNKLDIEMQQLKLKKK